MGARPTPEQWVEYVRESKAANIVFTEPQQEIWDKFEAGADQGVLAGGNACLAGEQEIYDPVADKWTALQDITESLHVHSWVNGHRVIRAASKPFIKAHDDIYEFTLSDGSRFRASPSHRLLCADGLYRAVSIVLQGGYALQESTAGTSPSTRGRDERRWSQTVLGSRSGCPIYRRSCDAPPLSALAAYKGTLPSQRDALKRTRSFSQPGSPRPQQARTRPYQGSAPHRVGSSGLRASVRPSEYVAGIASQAAQHGASATLVAPQPSAAEVARPQSETETPRILLASTESSGPYPLPPVLTVTEAVFVRNGEIWDIEVPGAGNYCVGGVVHHNSGKSYFALIMGLLRCWNLTDWGEGAATVRVVGLSWVQVQHVFEHYIDELVPPELVESYGHKIGGFPRSIRFWNGSVLHFSTVEQGSEMHQGARCDLIIYDEEPTWDIYEEGMFRTTRAGEAPKILFTMTPTKGKGWVWDELVEKRKERNIVYVSNAVFQNGSGVCPACLTTKPEWDAILRANRLSRDPTLDPVQGTRWMNLQMAAVPLSTVSKADGYCFRCWTFGVHPRANDQWVKDTLTRNPNPKRIAMRFLGSWENLDGAALFPHEKFSAIKAHAHAPRITDGTSRSTWDAPHPNHPYVVGVDCSRGVGRDETVFCVVDAYSGEQVAVWGNNNIKFTEYVHDLIHLAEDYGNAFCVIEDRGGGESIMPIMEGHKKIPLYAPPLKNRAGALRVNLKSGFIPSELPRHRILSNMVHAINLGLREDSTGRWSVQPGIEGAMYVNDPETAHQLGRMFYDEKGKIRSPGGESSHDDRVIALALALEGVRHPGTSNRLKRVTNEPLMKVLRKLRAQHAYETQKTKRGPWARR